jgi:hypothetical protein
LERLARRVRLYLLRSLISAQRRRPARLGPGSARGAIAPCSAGMTT